jgi:hypothetical protein
MQGVSKRANNGTPNVIVRQALRKRLRLKAYKPSIIQGLQECRNGRAVAPNQQENTHISTEREMRIIN